jgi:CubicO group peptidase (beta-lactamase class C family)
MFRRVWPAGRLVPCGLVLCLILAGYGADETSLGRGDPSAVVSDAPVGAAVSFAPTEANSRSISIITEEPYGRRFVPLLDAAEKEMRSLGISGAAIAVVEGGEVTLAAGLGSKHPDREDPVLPTTLFRIGSVTKTLTAIGLLRLVEQEVVDLNAPITDYLPDFSFAYDANWAPSITVKNLLTHTSAIADYFEVDTPGYEDDDALSRYFSGPYGHSPYAYLMAPPGRMFNYTNVGYMLAGWVTESVSGAYYRHYMQEHVLAPLGMTRTFFLPEEVIADGDFACGSTLHWETGQPFVVEPNSYDNGWGRPAGLAFSNVLDLAQIVKFLRDGQPDVLSDEFRVAMQEPQVDTQWLMDFVYYGYGLIIEEAGFYHPTALNFYRMRMVSHGGDVYGFSADVYYAPDLDLGFVALTNASYAHLDTSFATALTTLREMPTPSPLPDVSMSTADYLSYEGHYYDRFNVGDVTVRFANNQLTVDIPLLEAAGLVYGHTLVPATRNNFILYLYGLSQFDAFPLQVTFIRDDQGASEYLRTRSFVAHYEGEVPAEPGGRRPPSLQTTEALRVSLLKRFIPEPRLPFITPPGD